jgi:hypothetical protein
MNVSEYAEKVVNDFIIDITDYVFLSIEQDDDRMRKHLRSVSDLGLDEVNTTIGKKVKEILHLENIDENNEPKSRLIKSYTRHKVK